MAKATGIICDYCRAHAHRAAYTIGRACDTPKAVLIRDFCSAACFMLAALAEMPSDQQARLTMQTFGVGGALMRALDTLNAPITVSNDPVGTVVQNRDG